MLTLRRFKTRAVFGALVVLFIGVAITFGRAHDHDRDADSGFAGPDENVYWDAFIRNVKYDSGADTANSDHGFYVENGSTENVKIEYEFTHRFMKGSSVLIPRKRLGSKMAYKRNHPRKSNPRSASDTEDYRLNVSSYDGSGHKIDAYTRIRLLYGSGERNILDETFSVIIDDITLP